MTTPAKAPRDRSFGGAPRLMPRATAASAARAARNASNRNLANGSPQRGSPRSMTPPKGKITTPPPQRKFSETVKVRSHAPPPQRIPRIETIQHQPKFCEEVKVADDPDILPQDNDSMPLPIDDGKVLIEALSSVTIEGKIDDHAYGCDATIPEISENEMESHFKQNQEDPPMGLNTQDELKTANVNQTATPRSSRPQTPKSLESSRPQTPGMPSRPTTPAHPAQRNVTPSSRPTTPQRLPASRPRTPNVVNMQQMSRAPASPLRPCHQQSINEADDLKSTFIVKQRQFHQMKKELDLKQQAVLEVLDSIRTLRERMNQEGVGSAEGALQQDFVVFNVGDWTAEEISHLCRDALEMTVNAERAGDLIGSLTPIDDRNVGELDEKVLAIPSHFADLCLQALTARQEIIDWVKELILTKQESTDHGDGQMIDRIAHYNDQGRDLCDTLRELKNRADDIIDSMAQISKRTIQERGILMAVGESLVREVARLRQELENRSAVLDEIKENQIDIESSNEEIRRELEEERAARNGMKERLATAEYQLRQARIRISKMDRQLRESEASITSLTSTVKSLEDQSRQKELHLEARARKLKESLKTGEMTNNQLLQQRESLQTEVENLKHQLENMTTAHKSALKELTNQLNETKMALEEQKVISAKETDQREATEAALTESQNYIEELKSKITELENSSPNPDLPTEREMDLWAELQATKDTLHIAEEEVTACKREKVRFLESLTKITESESKIGMQQKLAAELLSKEEILGKMQIQIRELTKSIKLNEQKVIQYEQYVRDLQAHNRAVADRQESPESLDYQDLQQETMSLRLNLLEAAHRNEELTELLNKREQQLDQQDKTSRAQARVLKVREELINMLKNKETEQSRELCTLQQDLEHRMKIVDEVNKQIAAKADEIQELFVTLESKQQQIHRLEKIVLALEEQQRRAQAQRTRHEEKIAALEHELAAGGRRERKFLFF